MRLIDLFTFQNILTLPYATVSGFSRYARCRVHYDDLHGRSGIYFIVQENIPLYIGMSADIRPRLANHSFRQFPQLFPWIKLDDIHIHFAAMDTCAESQIYQTECMLIQRYKPLCNRTNIEGPVFSVPYNALSQSPPWLKEIDEPTP